MSVSPAATDARSSSNPAAKTLTFLARSTVAGLASKLYLYASSAAVWCSFCLASKSERVLRAGDEHPLSRRRWPRMIEHAKREEGVRWVKIRWSVGLCR